MIERCSVIKKLLENGELSKVVEYFYKNYLGYGNSSELLEIKINYEVPDEKNVLLTDINSIRKRDAFSKDRYFERFVLTDTSCERLLAYGRIDKPSSFNDEWVISLKKYLTQTKSPLKQEFLTTIGKNIQQKIAEASKDIINSVLTDEEWKEILSIIKNDNAAAKPSTRKNK